MSNAQVIPSPARIQLGNAHNPLATYAPPVLWSALRNVMRSALAYNAPMLAKLLPTRLSPAQLTQCCLQLLDCEREICERLADTPAYPAYLKLDGQMQQRVLFAKLPAPPAAELPFSQQMNGWLAEQATVVGAAGADAFARRLELLRTLQCLEPGTPGADPTAEHHLNAWLSYFAWRRIVLINELEEAYYLHDEVFNEARLNQQLNSESDLGLWNLQAFRAAPVLRSRPAAPGASAAPDPDGEYATAKANLSALGRELQTVTKNLSATADKAKLEAYATQYAALTQKQAAYAYLLEQKRAELPLTTSLTEKAKDYFDGNRQNTSLVLKETGKALLMGAGLTLGKALVNWGKGEPVDPNLGQKVMTGLLIGVGTAAVTYLLGPVGPMVSNLALGYFFPQPDPLMDSIKKVQSTLDLGFRQTEKRFDDLARQIGAGFANVIEEVKAAVEHGTAHGDLLNRLHTYQEHVTAADKLLSDMDNAYTVLFGDSPANTLDEAELSKLHTEFTNKVDQLVKLFYHPGYRLLLAQIDTAVPATNTPLAHELIRFYQKPGRSFRPFHEACAEVSAITARLRLLVLRYFEIRPRYEKTLAALTVCFSTSLSKDFLLKQLIDLHRNEDDERAAYFAGVMMLDRLVLGAGNYALYQTLLARPPHSLSLLDGFGLVVPDDPTRQLELVPQALPGGEDAWFRSAPLPATPDRYYLRLSAAPKEPYELVTFGDREWPITTPLHVALDLHDRLTFHNKAFTTALSARVLPLQDKAFRNSFEQFVLANRTLPLHEVYAQPDHRLLLRLPRQGYQLELSVRQTPYEGSGHAPFWSSSMIHSSNGVSAEEILAGIDPTECFWEPRARILNPKGEAVAQWLLPNKVPMLRNLAPAMATAIQPYHTPEAVGVRVNFPFCEGMFPGGKNFEWQQAPFSPEPVAGSADHHRLARYGIWTSAQAAGTFRPADLQAPGASEQAFRHLLFPGQRLVSLRSANGAYWLQFDQHRTDERILSLYHRGERGRSVFDKYTYKNSQFAVTAELQDDGNFVLHDATRHAVAATHTNGQWQTFLHLTDDGRLLLRSLADGSIRQTLALHEVNVALEGNRNRWFSGSRINQDSQLHSANGQYRLEFMHLLQPSGIVYNTGMIPVPDMRDWPRHGFSLTIYKDGKAPARREHTKLMIPPLTHNDQDFESNEYWHHCSDEMIRYLDQVVENSSQVRTFLEFHGNGELVGMIGTRKTYVWIKSLYGIKPVHYLYRPKQSHPQGAYVRLTDEGKLQVVDTLTGQVITTLLE